MFLDSGDLIEIGLIASISKYTNQDLIIGAVKVSRGNLITIRKQPDLKLINYINPIYLGSVLVKLKFVDYCVLKLVEKKTGNLDGAASSSLQY